jgi:diguanylate cyclase (GGDEF)-like protein
MIRTREVPSARVLVVEDDPATRQMLADLLADGDFDVSTAATGERGLDLLRSDPPSLVLLDQMLPGMSGVDVCRRIRSDSNLDAIPVVMLTAITRSSDHIAGLDAGADDYVTKPFHAGELVARLRSHLRRSRRERQLNPLTGLPGNLAIDDEIKGRLHSDAPFAVAWIDLDNFKVFNDCYGFSAGDRVIERTGRLLCDVLKHLDPAACFAGHIGGDDFAVIMALDLIEKAGRMIVEQFDRLVPAFYRPVDLEQGYVVATSRTGQQQHFPLMSISVAIVPCPVGRFVHPGEVTQVAGEIKHFLKQQPGSGWLVDRRSAESPTLSLAD